MTRMLRMSLGLVVILALASITFGTMVPATSHSSPYFSSLSNLAVSTAEACPCNLKDCSNNVCFYTGDIDNPTACCMQGTHCVRALCFP